MGTKQYMYAVQCAYKGWGGGEGYAFLEISAAVQLSS